MPEKNERPRAGTPEANRAEGTNERFNDSSTDRGAVQSPAVHINGTAWTAGNPYHPDFPKLLPHHVAMLRRESGIADDLIRQRGYRSVLGKKDLAELGFSSAQQRAPGLLIPLFAPDATPAGYQYRPDKARVDDKGRPRKYENPPNRPLRVDCPPQCRPALADPSTELFVTEGVKKADAAASHGLCIVALPGVWGFKSRNDLGGVAFNADLDYVPLKDRRVTIAYDSDVMGNPKVRAALERLTEHVTRKGARARWILLPGGPNGEKVGLDDFLLAHAVDELDRYTVTPTMAPPPSTPSIVTKLSAGRDRPLNDAGNGLRFLDVHGRNVRYTKDGDTWHLWDERRWHPDKRGAVVQMAKESVPRQIFLQLADCPDKMEQRELAAFGLRSGNMREISNALKAAQVEPAVSLLPSEFDVDPWLLNCLNGTVDLRTGELRPHRREDLLTKLCPVEYDPTARLDLWERFLDEATNGNREYQSFLQRAVGYTLTADTREEVLFFVHGPRAAGKSTFVESVKAALGDYATTADFEAFLSRRDVGGPRNDIARLAGSRLVASIEVDEGKKLAEGLVKMLTGGDTVTARLLYREAFEFLPTFKLWLCANHAPEVNDDDGAMWRRILRLPFEHEVPKEKRDPTLKARLRDPAIGGPAILAWAVRGCLDWQTHGLVVPKLVEDATEAYRKSQDPLSDFLADCCVLDAQAQVRADLLRETYEKWAKDFGVEALKGRAFGERLRSRGCRPERTKSSRYWAGIGLVVTESVTVTDCDGNLQKLSLANPHVGSFRNNPSQSVTNGESVTNSPLLELSGTNRDDSEVIE